MGNRLLIVDKNMTGSVGIFWVTRVDVEFSGYKMGQRVDNEFRGKV